LPYSSIKDMWMDGYGLMILYFIVFCLMGYLIKRHIFLFRGMLTFAFLYLFHFLLTDYNASRQSKIIVYDVFGGYLIDIFDGKTCYTLKSADLSSKSENFAADNNRMMHRISNVKDVSHNFKEKGMNFEKAGNLIRSGNTLFYVYRPGEFNEILKHDLKIDYCYITSDKLKVNEFKGFHHNVNHVILDRNLRSWQRKLWNDSLSNSSVRIHDVKDAGALKVKSSFR